MKTPLPMNDRDVRIEAAFNEAVAQTTATRREEVIARAEESIREEVRELVRAHVKSSDFLEDEALSPEIEAELARLKPEEVGERIGPYKLLQQIGEGGFGTVWMAEQEQPVRRRVALKIIKMGMDTKEVIA